MTSQRDQQPNELHQQQSPIIYIMVVGFHHKKGCQLEFVYPESSLIKKNAAPTQENVELYTLPKKWRHLPSLALPDGSHNYTSDYIYFHLEDESSTTESPTTNTLSKSKSTPNKTLFGLSCYRQINADELINKDSDVTRNTLQKSVCILSTRPLYASSVRFKLHAITCAYFEQKDFSRTQLLIDAFNSTLHVNSATLSDYSINSLNSCDNYMCLSLGDLVLRYQHKILILFKLLLLQKKCLFQIKPVSSLSNTIMSLVSLIPDMLQSNKHGLDYCSGFFDSIDLVNCELERKANKRNELLKHPVSTPMLNSTRKKLKSSKKSLKLTSSSSSSSSSSSPSVSISSSPVSMVTAQFSSSNSSKQKSARLFDPTASSSSLINNLAANDENSYSFSKNLDDLNEKTNTSLRLDDQPKLSVFKKTDSHNQIDLFKSKMFKFVDSWSTTPTTASTNKLVKSSSSSQITPNSAKNSKYNLYTDETIDEEDAASTHSSDKMNIEDLLKLDFGMPLKLFSQFNTLHPYLSLYYLDYFTMINKMNTKLYCTTTLMMSMMNEAANKQEKQSNESLVDDSNQSSSSNVSSTSYNSFKSPVPPPPPPNLKSYSNYLPQQQPQANYGYTIGATNILFKQRLYDDLDVFIDDTQIDMKQNDTLKKQLQLSTADLRFADYIIKQVNVSRNAMSGGKSAPTLLSIKKTSSTGNLDKSGDDLHQTNSSFEGSDDWIRLHFKWYLFNMLASMLKEDLCNELRCEIEAELVKLNNESINIACSSSNSSTLSLATNNKNNDVVDIDDYIEKSNTPTSAPTADTEEKKQKKRNKLKLSRKNSSNHSLTNSSTLSSISSSYLNADFTYLNYKDDYNAGYLSEFKQTDCFKEWYDANRSKLEGSLFKMPESDQPVVVNTSESKLDSMMKRLKQLDEIGVGHPFNGQMGVNDIKLKFNFLITTTESGRKLNKALADTSKIVNSTGKAVGEAFSHAKSTFSSFLNNWSSSSLLSPVSSPVQLNPSSSSNLSTKSSKSK